jgi:hyperosmotically inducible periplasmic protein
MRLLAHGSALTLAALVLAACDNTPRVDNVPNPDTTDTATTASRPKSDALITTEIQSKYFVSREVKAHRIDVDTNDGVVTLAGTVERDEERIAAEAIARDVSGVSRVDNRLTIRASGDKRTAGSQHHGSDPAAIRRDGRTPGWITAKIQSQYYLNPELKPWRIDVDTSPGGVVTLSGSVDSEGDRNEAVRVARATEGVSRVDDNLRVAPNAVATTGAVKDTTAIKEDVRDVRDQATRAARGVADKVEDGWITMKIQSKYFADDDVRARNINVETKDGMVTLKGSVQSEGERQQAVSLARFTDGVTMVHDNLVIDRGTSNASRGSGPRGSVDGAIEDGWITMKVQSKFFIHDEIKSRTIDVDTKSGVVTLSGSVPSDAARNAAEVIAKDTDGVSRVVNKLKVDKNS